MCFVNKRKILFKKRKKNHVGTIQRTTKDVIYTLMELENIY